MATSIRLTPETQAILVREAKHRGVGLSTFIRQLSEAEADRLRRDGIRAESARVAAAISDSASARAEIDLLGTPQTPHPDDHAL